MSNDDIIALVGDLGFPIFVAGYLLLRTDKMMREIVSAIKELTQEMRRAQRSN